MIRAATVAGVCLVMAVGSVTLAGDWPTYQHGNSRGGITDEALDLPLHASWVFTASRPPQPAWPAPAGQDFYHRHFNLRAIVAFDQALQVVGADGFVYFGASADDKVCALDARTGEVRWTFFTEGPVRFAPTVQDGRVYVGSDDGYVYCLAAQDGTLLWRFQVAPQRRLVPGNGRMISLWPVRTGLVVDGGTLYCTAGLFPGQGAFLVALDATDGALKYRHAVEVSPQGYIVASPDRLYIPTGRTDPAIFSRVNGAFEGTLPSGGGAYALLVDDVLVTGPGRGAKQLNADDTRTKDAIATFGGLRMLVNGSIAYMQSEQELAAFDRGRYLELSRVLNGLEKEHKARREELKKTEDGTPQAATVGNEMARLAREIGGIRSQLKACYLWTVASEYPYAMIMAGDTLFVGGQDTVAAVSCASGDVVWTAAVKGKACGLSVVQGGLYVSTDLGQIHRFAAGANTPKKVVAQEVRENPYGEDEFTARYRQAAAYIAEQAPSARGYCLVLDCGEGRLAYELARRTDLNIIGVERDRRRVDKARRLLTEAGLYGRVVVHHLPEGPLPYTSCFANLIVSDTMLRRGTLSYSGRDLLRLTRPFGGVIVLGRPGGGDSESALKAWGNPHLSQWQVQSGNEMTWGTFRRGALPGSGEWTHMYAEPGNGACSADEVVKGPMALQWFGEPGPVEMIDRHHRNVPPLSKDGRLFVSGDCVVYGMDAYNGTVFWRTEVPNSRRLGVFLDCGNTAVDERFLYVAAEGGCRAFDVTTGRPARTYRMPQPVADAGHVWGYLAYDGDILFGSGCRPGAAYTETSYDADEALWYRDMKLVTSDYLFARDKGTDAPLWTYRDGLVINATIAVGAGRVYFVETNGSEALADKLGRMPAKTLFADGDQHLVALDERTGKIIFRQKIDVTAFEEPVYLNYAKGVLLLSGSRLVDKIISYSYQAFDAGTATRLWQASHDTQLAIDGAHGEYNRHPTIIGETVYAWPYGYDLKTGARADGWAFDRRGHGCGGVSASAQCLFWRGGNPWMYDLGPDGGPSRLSEVSRPGCWINMIPAAGLVLIPEASSGCTCGFSLQTSMAFIPKAALN